MNTDQARAIIAAHDNADRALQNLRNAGAMSSDDPRATELLEEAGDSYIGAARELWDLQARTVEELFPDAPSLAETPVEDPGEGEPPKAA